MSRLWSPRFRGESGRRALWIVLMLISGSGIAAGEMVTLESIEDNTLYQNGEDNAGNGAGNHFFVGTTLQGDIRRGLVRFDVAGNVPPGATIESASLQLYMSRARSSTGRSVVLHRASASWGEGTSHAPGEEGAGTSPSVDEATWFYRFYPTQAWVAPGGDYAASPSAETVVGGNGNYQWSSPAMASDVQGWREDPESNFGWIVIGTESVTATAKRFQSRSIASANQRPRLMIHYTLDPGVDAGSCCLPDGTCIILTESDCASASGSYQGDDTTCSTNPCTGLPITIQITTSRDNTLYEESGAVSNGAGEFFFTGRQSSGIKRRAVIGFDLASVIPQGALVSEATLTLRTTQGGSAANDVKLHRARSDWGEGTSDALGDEWIGAPATSGDATWTHRLYPSALWNSPGGDYEPVASASAYVAFESFYSWSSAGMLDDLQRWVDDPDANFGWVMIGQETGGVTTQKRFASHENANATYRPLLEITYSVPPKSTTGACCMMGGMCEVVSALACGAMGGMYLGDGVACMPGACGPELEPYVDALPIPRVAVPMSGSAGAEATYRIPIIETQQQLHRDLPPTTIWGYDGIYPGPTIEARRDEPVTVTWVSDLRDSTGTLRTTHYLPVDLCLHGPNEEGPTPRTVVHLHGGHVPADSDGYPEDAILPGEEQTFVYPNRQLASTLWYHDHALGITRLNVLLGLAGFYIVRDAFEESLTLPSGPYEVPLVIQDRSFRADGSFYYPAEWEEHFVGDKTLVNGKVWPYFEAERGAYRFRMLNGSNSRTYTLALSNGAPMTLIGGDGGLLRAPVVLDSLTIHPGERADVIIDFSKEIAGSEILLRNSALAPYPYGDSSHPPLEAVMKFIVRVPAGFAWSAPDSLRPMQALEEADAVESRDFTLEKFNDPCTGSIWLINGQHWPHIHERPRLGSTEIWRFINRSGMAHPMHMHLVMFQVLDIQPFTVVNDTVQVTGPPMPPEPSMAGWKDTVPVMPGEMVRVIARFDDYLGKFPYHCHMLEHEDHDMMRQFEVVDSTSTGAGSSDVAVIGLQQSSPNPAVGGTSIRFQLATGGPTRIDIFDIGGRRVATPLDEPLPVGEHTLWWESRDEHGRALTPGMYFYKLTAPNRPTESKKLIILE
jgi:spore coat protein A